MNRWRWRWRCALHNFWHWHHDNSTVLDEGKTKEKLEEYPNNLRVLGHVRVWKLHLVLLGVRIKGIITQNWNCISYQPPSTKSHTTLVYGCRNAFHYVYEGFSWTPDQKFKLFVHISWRKLAKTRPNDLHPYPSSSVQNLSQHGYRRLQTHRKCCGQIQLQQMLSFFFINSNL